MERKVGEKFEIQRPKINWEAFAMEEESIKLEVCEAVEDKDGKASCVGCFYNHAIIGCSMSQSELPKLGDCSRYDRSDKKSVIFRRIK